jgi:HEAT repeat protein
VALGIIENYRVSRLIERILAAPSSDSPKARAAIDKLKEIGKPAIPLLIEALGTTDKTQTQTFTIILAKLLNNSTLPLYIKGLSEAYPRVATNVTHLLQISESFDPNLLIGRFDDDTISRTALINILEAHKEHVNIDYLLKQVYKLDISNQNAIFRVIGDIVSEAQIPELISRLGGKDQNIRAQIARILGRFSSPAVIEALQGVAYDSNKLVRLEAVKSLTGMDVDLDLPLLIKLLSDPDLRIQELSVNAIIRMNHPKTIEHLIEPLQDDNEYVRRAAVEVLNEVATADSLKELLQVIKDRDWWVRERAADALAKIGGPKVIDAMLQLIKDDDKFVRRTAIEIINSSKDPRTVDYLIDALADEDWWVRERTVDALASVGSQRAVKPLLALAEKDDRSRPIVMQALANIGDQAVAVDLLPYLEDPDPNVQKEVLNALSVLTDEMDAEVINQSIFTATQSANDEVRELATQVVKQITGRFPHAASAQKATSEKMKDSLIDSMSGSSGLKEASDTGTAETQKMDSVAKPVSETINLEALKPGQMIGDRYQFVRKVGKGAFGTVLLVNDTVVDEQIILKFINTQLAGDESAIKRFIHELRYTRRVTHPNVIRIFDLLNFGEWQAISMEYFHSHTLAQEIKRAQHIDVQKALNILIQITRGMQAAHNAGVIHRDMKPPNILINDEGLVKVVDFGIAAAARNTETRLTKTGTLVGTPTYIAPEQVLGKPVDNRTDIYSLGIIMYEMLSGSPPYSGDDYMSLMYQHVQGTAPLLYTSHPEISKTLSAIVAKTMAVEPDKRYQSMDELRERLELLLE